MVRSRGSFSATSHPETAGIGVKFRPDADLVARLIEQHGRGRQDTWEGKRSSRPAWSILLRQPLLAPLSFGGPEYHPMLSYSFGVRNNDATEIEDLGDMALADDGEALAFAKQVIRDLMQDGAE